METRKSYWLFFPICSVQLQKHTCMADVCSIRCGVNLAIRGTDHPTPGKPGYPTCLLSQYSCWLFFPTFSGELLVHPDSLPLSVSKSRIHNILSQFSYCLFIPSYFDCSHCKGPLAVCIDYDLTLLLTSLKNSSVRSAVDWQIISRIWSLLIGPDLLWYIAFQFQLDCGEENVCCKIIDLKIDLYATRL